MKEEITLSKTNMKRCHREKQFCNDTFHIFEFFCQVFHGPLTETNVYLNISSTYNGIAI